MARDRRRPTRIGPRTHIFEDPGAWTVAVVRRGETFSRYFSHAVFGGRRKALLAAQRFRDGLLKRIEPDSRERHRIPKGQRSKTGVVGVSLEPHRVDGRVYERYVAHWHDPEKGPQRRRFPVGLHGREQALGLAIEAREAGVAHLRAYLLARQQQEATRRLQKAPPLPRPVKTPLSRKGISMARRQPRRVK